MSHSRQEPDLFNSTSPWHVTMADDCDYATRHNGLRVYYTFQSIPLYAVNPHEVIKNTGLQ